MSTRRFITRGVLTLVVVLGSLGLQAARPISAVAAAGASAPASPRAETPICPPGHYIVFVLGTSSDGLGAEFDDIKRELLDRDKSRSCERQFLGFSYDDRYVESYDNTLVPGVPATDVRLRPLNSFERVPLLQLNDPNLFVNNIDDPRFYRQCSTNAYRDPSEQPGRVARGRNPCSDRRSTAIEPEETSVSLDNLLQEVSLMERINGRTATFDLVGHSLGGYLITYWAATRLCSPRDCVPVPSVEARQIRNVVAIEAPLMGRPYAFAGGLCQFTGDVFETVSWLENRLVIELLKASAGPLFAEVAVELAELTHLVESDDPQIAADARAKTTSFSLNLSRLCEYKVAKWLDPLSGQTARIRESDVENKVALAIVRSMDDQIVPFSHATLIAQQDLCNPIDAGLNVLRSLLIGRDTCQRGYPQSAVEPTGVPVYRDFAYSGGFNGYDPLDQSHETCSSFTISLSLLVPRELACMDNSHQIFPRGAAAAAAFLSQEYSSLGSTPSYRVLATEWREAAPAWSIVAARGCGVSWISSNVCEALSRTLVVHSGERVAR